MSRPRAVPLIGVAGGIASGKSFVAGALGRQGAAVVSADEWAHKVLKREDVKTQIIERWGPAVLDASGQIDRAAVARIVFAPPPDGPRELKYLEQLTHPKIGEEIRRQIDQLRSDPATQAIVLDVPLLFEAGWNKVCDKIVFVDSPAEIRFQRAQARGWTREDFDRREGLQESLETKRNEADVILDNSGSQASLDAQIERSWRKLVDASPSPPNH